MAFKMPHHWKATCCRSFYSLAKKFVGPQNANTDLWVRLCVPTFPREELEAVFKKTLETCVKWGMVEDGLTLAVTKWEKGDNGIRNKVDDLSATYDGCLRLMVSNNHKGILENIHRAFPASIAKHSQLWAEITCTAKEERYNR